MILLLIAIAILAWVGRLLYRDYVETAGSTGERLLGAFQHKASLIATRGGAILMAGLSIIAAAAEYLGAPGLTAFLSGWMSPQYVTPVVALIMAGIGWLREQNFSFEDKAPD
jgi:hypothetical protein